MSSVNRGTVRNKNDYYVTPQWLVHEFLERFMAEYGINPKSCRVLDPSAGGCEKHQMSYPTVLNGFGFDNVTTLDIRSDSRAEHKGFSFLEIKNIPLNDLIITNPPFDCSVEFTKKALENVKGNGHVVMLQRLNWLGSAKRKPFWDTAPLKEIYVHHKRAGFNPEQPNAKDSIEYAHFVFQRGYSGPVKLSII